MVHDHRGHGLYNKDREVFSPYTKENSFSVMVKDLKVINSFIHWRFKDKKIFMLGHSMGAYLSLKYSEVYGDTIDGLILSGIGIDSKVRRTFPVVITKFICGFTDANKPNKFVNKSVTKALNRGIKPKDGNFAFSNSKDNEELITRYRNDSLRVRNYTLKFYHDLFSGINHTLRGDSLKKVPKNLKILILGGEKDPVSSFTKGIIKLNNKLLKNGIDIKYKIYENVRHEIFVDKHKERVFEDILNFLESLK